MSENVMIIKGN